MQQRVQHDQQSSAEPHIVILGAGFAGVGAARELAKRLPRDQQCRVTLVDRNNFLLFTPMLTEVVGGMVETRHITCPVRRLSPRVTFEQAQVESIDLATRRVTIAVGNDLDGVPAVHKTLEADHLVIALGSVTNFRHVPGAAEHALTVKSIADATTIRTRALALLERADAEPDVEVRRALLTFVVAGGGYTGAETMAALNDLVRDAARNYPHIAPDDITCLIVEPEARLLPELSEGLAHYAATQLEKHGVRVLWQTKITRVTADAVEFDGNRTLPAHTIIWAAGIEPSPAMGGLDAHYGTHGALVADACCAVPGHPGVWALGDCAEIPDKSNKPYAPTAQNATREGAHVARNIMAELQGHTPRRFLYTPIGELALVGKRVGVADVYGVRITGLLAWLMWRVIYLAKLPLLSKRVRVSVDWSLDILFGQDVAEVNEAS